MGIKTGRRVSLQAQPDGKLLIDLILEEREIKITKRIDLTGCEVKALTGMRYYCCISPWIQQNWTFLRKNTRQQKQTIRRVCYKLIGPEIIEESSSCVVIQDLLNPNELPIKKGVQRMFPYCGIHANGCGKCPQNYRLRSCTWCKSERRWGWQTYLLISRQFRSIFCGGRILDSAEISIEEYHESLEWLQIHWKE